MQSLPNIVRVRLQRPDPVPSHPDPDLLTAFAEQSLAGEERERVTQHLARCGDCREVIALALPATESVIVASSASQRANWLTWPVLRWGVVTAGILAVTSVGVLQLKNRHQERTASPVFMARTQAGDSVQGMNAPTASREEPSSTQRSSQSTSAARSDKSSGSVDAAFAKQQPAPDTGSPVAVGGAMQTHLRRSFAVKKSLSSPLTAQSVRPTIIDPHAANSVGSTQSKELNGTAEAAAQDEDDDAEQTRVGKAKAALPQTSPAMAAAPSLRSDPALMKSAILPRWIISSSGTVQRSLDGGKTWADLNLAASKVADQVSPPQNLSIEQGTAGTKKLVNENSPVAPATVFRALSVSPNASEVWAGGTNGILYHTLDAGNLWVRVTPSSTAVTLSGDIISIQFPDKLNGTVSTSSGEVWITDDDGQTWTRQ